MPHGGCSVIASSRALAPNDRPPGTAACHGLRSSCERVPWHSDTCRSCVGRFDRVLFFVAHLQTSFCFDSHDPLGRNLNIG